MKFIKLVSKESELIDPEYSTPSMYYAKDDEMIGYFKGKEPVEYEMVDLGLPSGLKWANMNVGSTGETDYGKYFAWGDTTGCTSSEVSGKFTQEWYNGLGLTSITADLTSEQDAAAVNMGSEWRMPSTSDIEELQKNTKMSTEEVNGVPCLKFTSKIEGYTDKYILFPTSGEFIGDTNTETEKYFYIWAKTYLGEEEGLNFSYIFYGENSTPMNSLSIKYTFIGSTIRGVHP